jgi:hypothetical protein
MLEITGSKGADGTAIREKRKEVQMIRKLLTRRNLRIRNSFKAIAK